MVQTRSSTAKRCSSKELLENEAVSPFLATESEDKTSITSDDKETIPELIIEDLKDEESENDLEYEEVDEGTFIKESFEVFDKNKDGFICKEDLKALFASMDEDHSDSAISKMIGKFNQDVYKNSVISLSSFKERLLPKIKNPYSPIELANVFQKVREITDGIQIVDTENIIRNAVIEFDGILEALEANIICGIGSLGKDELRVIFGEMESAGNTHGITLAEFSDLMEEYATNIFVMFGALLVGAHRDEHQVDCENDTGNGIRVLNADGTLSQILKVEAENSQKRPFKNLNVIQNGEANGHDDIINTARTFVNENGPLQKTAKLEIE